MNINLDDVPGLREQDKRVFQQIHASYDADKLSCHQIESDDQQFVPGKIYVVEHDTIMIVNEELALHCLDGPAEYSKDYFCFYVNGIPHRVGGPSEVYLPESDLEELQECYWLEGRAYSKQEYWSHPTVIQHLLSSIHGLEETQTNIPSS